MKVLFATSEIAPWVKTGGLGDVAGSLTIALRSTEVDVRVLVPWYPALQAVFPNPPVVAQLESLGGELPAASLRSTVTEAGVPLFLLDCAICFERPGSPYLGPDGRNWSDNDIRFALLARVAAWLGSDDCTLDWRCDIVHCNDWQSSLAPAFLHYLPTRHARSVVTVHNLAFQGIFEKPSLARAGLPESAWRFDSVEHFGHFSFLKAGLQHADAITTVSPTYATEIQTDEGGMGLGGLLRWRSGSLKGILNGIDTDAWNPASDPLIAAHYDVDHIDAKAANKTALQHELGLALRDDIPLLGVVSRLTEQKGHDLLPQIADALAGLPAQLAVLGSSDTVLEQQLTDMARRHRDMIAVNIGFNERLAHLIEAGADMFLMPSRFEPCGLNQMYSLRYGTPPIVRATGGLADTVVDCNESSLRNGSANGFSFLDMTASNLFATITRAVETWHGHDIWRRLQRHGMATNFSWQRAASEYVDVYRGLLGLRPDTR